MPYSQLTLAEAQAFFPETQLGVMQSIKPLTGFSGSPTYHVLSEAGEYVLRIQRNPISWDTFVRSQEKAAEAGLCPGIRWKDEAKQVIVTAFIPSVPLFAALGQDATRPSALKSLASQLVRMQSLDASDLPETKTGFLAREVWGRESRRPGFPTWTLALKEILDDGFSRLESDRRRSFSHGDMNPSNVLWDGEKAWFVDWEKAGANHPYLDMAVISNFLSLPNSTSLELFESNGLLLKAEDREIFRTLRRFADLVYGLIFFALIPDLTQIPWEDPDFALGLRDCFARLNAGPRSLQEPAGKAMLGTAFLRQSRTW